MLGYVTAEGRGETDLLIRDVAERLRAAGFRVAGAVQVNLETDPAESMDLSAEHPEKVLALQEDIERFRQQQLYYYQSMSPRERSEYYPPRL